MAWVPEKNYYRQGKSIRKHNSPFSGSRGKSRLIDAGKPVSALLQIQHQIFLKKHCPRLHVPQLLHVHSLCYHQNADADKNIRTSGIKTFPESYDLQDCKSGEHSTHSIQKQGISSTNSTLVTPDKVYV